ncbi:MAG: GNAT family N-acetyltransferase [Anaerolineae bacterium]|nr:GNAT family N-acetyltransferase [Anaerolineae bacterium]
MDIITIIRRAVPEDAETLTQITWLSKAHWGYDEAFMAVARPIMRIQPGKIRDYDYFVLETDGQMAGFYSLEDPQGETITLENLFIDPDHIGTGFGKQLLHHALATARNQGYQTVVLEADPNAEAFYLKMGAKRVGEHESTVLPGRMLPVMRFDLIQFTQLEVDKPPNLR